MKRKLQLGCLSIVPILPFTLVVSCAQSIEPETKIYKVDSKVFNSKKQLESYLKDNYEQTYIPSSNNWSLFDGEKNTYFDSLKKIYKNLDSFIKNKKTFLPRDVHSISDQGRLLKYPISDSPESKNVIYKGKNGDFFLSEKEAIKSLIQIHDAYKFKGVYFRSKEEFKRYLMTNDEVLKTFDKTYEYFKDDQNHISEPLDTKNKNGNKDIISNFVNSYSRGAIELKDGSIKTIDNLTSNDVSLSDIPYYRVMNTGGKGSYSIDVNSSTPGSLIGPSILKTEIDPTQLFVNKKLWQSAPPNSNKMNSNPIDLFQEKIFDATIGMAIHGAFNSNSIVDLLTKNFDNIYTKKWKRRYANLKNNFSQFRYTLNNYSTSIKGNNSIGLFDALKTIEKRISHGKNFGILKSVSILRSWLIDSSIHARVPVGVIQSINESFDSLMRFINFKVHSKIDPVLSDKAREFDIARVFNFKHLSTYGEMPKTYIQRFISGKDIVGGEYPEATEILLNSGMVVGILDEAEKQRQSKNYDLPKKFNSILHKESSYFKSSLLSVSTKEWNHFIKNDNLAISTYHPNSTEYKQNIERLSGYLASQKKIYSEYSEVSSYVSFKEFLKRYLQNNDNKHKSFGSTDNSSANNELKMMAFGGMWAVMELSGVLTAGAGPIGALISIGLSVALNLSSAIMGEVKYDAFSYTHNDSSKQKYYWNGASHKEHKFFGISFGNSNVIGKESLKIIEPIKIQSESLVDKFYYDKKLYDSKEEMKLQFLKDLKNGKTTSMKKIQQINLMDKNGVSKTYKEKTTKDLTESILKVWNNNKYSPVEGHVSSGGISFSGTKKAQMVNQILSNYKPIRIVEAPDKGSKRGGGSKYEPVYPGLYVMPVTRKNYLYGAPLPLNETLEHTYWTYDPNVIENKSKNILTNPSEKSIIKKFKECFSIKRKSVLKQDIIVNNEKKYHEIDEAQLVLSTVFEAKAFNGEIEVFLNKGQAYSWLLSKMFFTFIKKHPEKRYVYKKHIFLSSFELMEWVLKNQGGINV